MTNAPRMAHSVLVSKLILETKPRYSLLQQKLQKHLDLLVQFTQVIRQVDQNQQHFWKQLGSIPRSQKSNIVHLWAEHGNEKCLCYDINERLMRELEFSLYSLVTDWKILCCKQDHDCYSVVVQRHASFFPLSFHFPSLPFLLPSLLVFDFSTTLEYNPMVNDFV